MSVVNVSWIAKHRVEIAQYARNGKPVSAELQSRIADMVGSAAWVRTKQVFARSTPIENIPDSTSGQRKRWRFAWHTGPYTRTLLVWMELAPQNNEDNPTSPYGLLQVAARSAPSTIVAQAKVAWGSSDGSYSDVPINFGGASVMLVDPSDGVTPVSLDADTDYIATVSDFDYGRIMSCTVWEVSIDPDTDEGWASTNASAGAPIYDSDRSVPALMLRNLWKSAPQQVYNWCSETDATAPVVVPPVSLAFAMSGSPNPIQADESNIISWTCTPTVGGTGQTSLSVTIRTEHSNGSVPDSPVDTSIVGWTNSTGWLSGGIGTNYYEATFTRASTPGTGTYPFIFEQAASATGTITANITAGSSTEVPSATLTDATVTIGDLTVEIEWDEGDDTITEDTSTQFTFTAESVTTNTPTANFTISLDTGCTTSSPTTVSNVDGWTIGSWSAPGGGTQWQATVSISNLSANTPTSITFATTPSTAGTLVATATAGSNGHAPDWVATDSDSLTVESAAGAPTFQAAGTATSGVGAVSPTWPTHLTNDVALLLCESEGSEAVTLSDAQGFVEIPDSPQASTLATLPSRLTVFWCRASSGSMTAPTVADPGNHVVAQILTFRGCTTSGNPWDVTAGDKIDTAATAFSIPGDTTTVPNTLVVAIVAGGRDLVSTAVASGWTNSDLTGLTEITDNFAQDGAGGGFAAACGTKASAGAYGATTGSLGSTAMGQGRISIALKP